MKKVIFLLIMNLFFITTIESQGLKGFNLGEKTTTNYQDTTVGGLEGSLVISTLNDGTIWQIFFYSNPETRGYSISSNEFQTFGNDLANHLNLQLQGYSQGTLGKVLDGAYEEYKGERNGVRVWLRFGDFNDDNSKNEIRCWITDIEFEKLNERQESNNKKNDY